MGGLTAKELIKRHDELAAEIKVMQAAAALLHKLVRDRQRSQTQIVVRLEQAKSAEDSDA